MDKIKNVFLNASAGSGKTFALCMRYIALLFNGTKANEILTITFTKEAANEMKERITNNLSLLYKLNNKQDSTIDTALLQQGDNLTSALQSYGITQDAIKSNIKDIYFSFLKDKNRISTIDSFFNGVLRRFCFFIGLRSDFNVRNSDDDGFNTFLLKVYQDSKLRGIASFLTQELSLHIKTPQYSRGSSLEELMQMLSNKSIEFASNEDFTYKMQPEHILQEAKQIAKDNNIQSIDNLYTTNYCKEKIKQLALDLSDYLHSVTPQDKLENGNLAKIHLRLRKDPQTICGSPLIQNGSHSWIDRSIKPDSHQSTIIESKSAHIRAYYRIYTLVLERDRLHNLYLLIDTYKTCMATYEDKENAVSFDSITRRMFDISTNMLDNGARFDSDYFYFRLDGLINHVLFDEYQDTSILQYRIFYPIFREILSGEGKDSNRTLFFVGDSKQSLYEFRGANKAVFEEGKKGLVLESLTYNYRSKKHIIDFVNEKFSCIFGEEYENQLYRPQGQNQDTGIVEIKIFKTRDDEEHIEELYSGALGRIEELLSLGIKCKDIAVLARHRNSLQDFIAFVETKKSPIEFNLDKSGKLINQKSILIIISALKLDYYTRAIKVLENKETENKSNLYNYLSNKKFHQKRLNKLLSGSYFNDVFISIPHYPRLSKQIKFIIEKFRLFDIDSLELLKISSENPHIKDIDTLLNSIQDIESSRMQEEAIRAMTIHGSKGLGFLHIIVLDFDAKDKKQSTLLYDYDGIYLHSLRLYDSSIYPSNNKSDDIDKNTYIPDSIKELLKKNRQLQKSQDANVLYVACTRAKDGLYIFATDKSSMTEKLHLQEGDSRGKLTALDNTKDMANDSISTTPKHIISKVKIQTLEQKDYLSEVSEDVISFIYAKKKQAIGLATHAFLELYMGFHTNKALEVIKSRYGFYLNDSELDSIYKKSQRFLNEYFLDGKLNDKLNLNNSVIECELSFLQKNSIYRIDAVLWHEGRLNIIEFKSTEDIDNVLLQKHTKQLESYMESLSLLGLGMSGRDIKGYLVYLQDEVKIKEVSI